MDRPSLLLERNCAFASALIAGTLCWWTWGSFSFPARWTELVGSIFTASATGAGFLFTAASILISMERRPVVRWGRETGAYALFAGYLTRGIAWCLLSAFITLCMLLPHFEKPSDWHRIVFSVWWFAISGAAIAVLRVILIFAAILRQASKDEV
jgi:tellurite resistance protein TehA-like permease